MAWAPQRPLIEHKERLQRLFKKEISGVRYSEHVIGDGPAFRAQACKLGLGGLPSWAWSISQMQREHHRKASATGPPTCSRSRGRILGTPGGARPAGVAPAGATKTSRRKKPITPADVMGRDEADCVASRAVDVQLQPVASDIANRLEWKRAEHDANFNVAASRESLCQQ